MEVEVEVDFVQKKGILCWRFYVLVKNCDEYEEFMG